MYQVNDTNLENVTHDEAVGALKATSEHVILTVAKPSFIPAPPEDEEEEELPPGTVAMATQRWGLPSQH